MISLILYGRNDSYGYNLHKRAALSLNCMAEVLTHEHDEILFVDYNTPDDYPTFPEAIADTLTAKTKSILRILRVRSDVHNSLFGHRTHLKALEPIARNVAIRRSNPDNKWILSTNTDMIFVTQGNLSLSESVARLEDGLYCAPRLELPETLWEGFNRFDPCGVIAQVRILGQELHLNEFVYGTDFIRYDAPGDFQLMPRHDAFACHGFNEDMLLGWHLDSNISKRFYLLYGKVSDASPFVFGYHCDHTRQITPAHAHQSKENSSAEFVDEVTSPFLPAQEHSWGLAHLQIEEFLLTQTVDSKYLSSIQANIGRPLGGSIETHYKMETFGINRASPQHVLPFLLDMFANFERSKDVFWVGPMDHLYRMFVGCWEDLGFLGAVKSAADHIDGSAVDNSSAYVLNFGTPTLVTEAQEDEIFRTFYQLFLIEQKRFVMGFQLRRFICINAIHNRFERAVTERIGAARTPFSTRMRHGYVLPVNVSDTAAILEEDWTQRMHVGPGGMIVDGKITSKDFSSNCLCYGPYICLMPGNYSVEALLDLAGIDTLSEACLRVEVVFAEKVRKTEEIRLSAAGRLELKISVTVSDVDFARPVQIRIFCIREIEIATNDNFNASGYLAANPDVEIAGMGADDHFRKYGLKERRAQFRGSFPVREKYERFGTLTLSSIRLKQVDKFFMPNRSLLLEE